MAGPFRGRGTISGLRPFCRKSASSGSTACPTKGAALLLGMGTPHTVILIGPEGELQACRLRRATPTDRFRPMRLIDRRPG